MKLAMKGLCSALLLTATASAASAQTDWYYYEYGPMARGYYGTPYGGGPQYGSGGGDQFGYGRAKAIHAKRHPVITVITSSPAIRSQ